jgi:hypothetical protein
LFERSASRRLPVQHSDRLLGFLACLDLTAAEAFKGPRFRLDRIHPHLALGTMRSVVARDDVYMESNGIAPTLLASADVNLTE